MWCNYLGTITGNNNNKKKEKASLKSKGRSPRSVTQRCSPQRGDHPIRLAKC